MAQTQTKPLTLTPAQVKRYSRHIIMPQVGSRGQRKLLESKVLIVGAGGLGSPSAVYLSLAGVGTIGIADFDVVNDFDVRRGRDVDEATRWYRMAADQGHSEARAYLPTLAPDS